MKLPAGIAPYFNPGPLAAFALGLSSGFPIAMIGATLTTRLAQGGIDKASITAFALAFLAYNFKVLWAPLVDRVRLPLLGRLGQRRAWLWLASAACFASVLFLGAADPAAGLGRVALGAILVGISGATLDIVIDAYRLELLTTRELGPGAGMNQYGYRIGNKTAAATALLIAASAGWGNAYALCTLLLLPALAVSFVMGEPATTARLVAQPFARAFVDPFIDFLRRPAAALILAFILVHKIGDTLANLTLRLLFDDLGYSNAAIAAYDVGAGFIGQMIGIFVGGVLYAKLGLNRSVIIGLILMAVSNLSFAALAGLGEPDNSALAATMFFEDFASGIGGVTVIAYFSALVDLRFTATQFALISALASIVGRVLNGTMAGGLIERLGYVDFYLLTTAAAVPGVLLFWFMTRAGLIDRSLARTE